MGKKLMNVLVFGGKELTGRRKTLIKKAVLIALGSTAKRKGELCVIFVPDREIRRINSEYLGHDYATDVLSFPYLAPPPRQKDDAPPFGDIYIARGVARAQAKSLGHDELTEWLTLAVHGALHLAGYDDRTKKEKERMFARQNSIVRRIRPSSIDGKKK
jgi:probable rRNA maturation factor